MESHEYPRWSPDEQTSDELANRLRDATTEACKQVEEFARKEPLTALAIAGGVGLLVGLMLTRR